MSSKKTEAKDSFKFLGVDFQDKLITQLLTDRVFLMKMMDLIDVNFFEESYRRTIAKYITDAWSESESLSDVSSVAIRARSKIKDEVQLKFLIDFLEISLPKLCVANDTLYVQQYAINFCKQQKLKTTIKTMDSIVNEGNPERYPECEVLMKKALELGQGNDDTINVCSNVDAVLADDFRKPIPTGITGLDGYMDGGLAKGELGVILAPFGVGKTTMITKMANHAKDKGYRVLQIFFEDNPMVIQRKHYTCWYNNENKDRITLNELNENKVQVKELVARKYKEEGQLMLKKFASDGTTIPKIRQYIRKITAQGFKPDIVFIDYIDCIQPAGRFEDQYAGEGNVMRAFETMLSELDIAGWTAVQGNRSSINADTVDSSMIGGSIKRGQIGHFIVSIAKTLEQKEEGTANMAILKSRFGKDGIIFRDIIFDNGRIIIDVSNAGGQTFLEAKKAEKDLNQHAVTTALEARKARMEKKRIESAESVDEIRVGEPRD